VLDVDDTLNIEHVQRPKFLVTGTTPDTGRYTPETLRRQGHSVRSLVYKHDERAECLKSLGVEVVVGDLLNLEDV
jgi:NAD(P)H dehydrogenase (quinone)